MIEYYESLTELHRIPLQSNYDLDSILCRVEVEIAFLNVHSPSVDDDPVYKRYVKFKNKCKEEIAHRILLGDWSES